MWARCGWDGSYRRQSGCVISRFVLLGMGEISGVAHMGMQAWTKKQYHGKASLESILTSWLDMVG